MDLSKPAVQDFIVESVFRVVDAISIDTNVPYLKWDFNRGLTDIFSTSVSPERQGEVAHRWQLGAYKVYQRIVDKYPNLLVEGCSGGGGKFDAGMLAYFPQYWSSDNTDAVARTRIQVRR